MQNWSPEYHWHPSINASWHLDMCPKYCDTCKVHLEPHGSSCLESMSKEWQRPCDMVTGVGKRTGTAWLVTLLNNVLKNNQPKAHPCLTNFSKMNPYLHYIPMLCKMYVLPIQVIHFISYLFRLSALALSHLATACWHATGSSNTVHMSCPHVSNSPAFHIQLCIREREHEHKVVLKSHVNNRVRSVVKSEL